MRAGGPTGEGPATGQRNGPPVRKPLPRAWDTGRWPRRAEISRGYVSFSAAPPTMHWSAVSALLLCAALWPADASVGPCVRNGSRLRCSELASASQLCPLLDDSVLSLHVAHSRLDDLRPDCLANATALRNLTLRSSGLSRSDFLDQLPESLEQLDLAHNALEDVPELGHLSALRHLSLSGNPIRSLAVERLAGLRRLSTLELASTELRWLDLAELSRVSSLRKVDVSESRLLETLVGRAGAGLEELDASGSAVSQLGEEVLAGRLTPLSVDLSGNPLDCGRCRLWWRWAAGKGVKWLKPNVSLCQSPEELAGRQLGEVPVPLGDDDCAPALDPKASLLFPGRYGKEAWLRCPITGRQGRMRELVWSRRQKNGTLEQLVSLADAGEGPVEWEVREGTQQRARLLPSGTLVLEALGPSSVRRYVCEAGGANATVTVRLDYSFWRIRVYVYSLFCGVATALGFFALHCVWAGIRAVVMWKLKRMEETSRLRKMLEALEKYRQRQLESLHEEYEARVAQVRDNCSAQSERLRSSYSSVTSYGAASLDSFQQGYSAQMGRVRDYGSRQTERLWESYQRQLNRIRTFSLHQRLRLARQYKLRHSHLTSILESLNLDFATPTVSGPPSAVPLVPGLPTLLEMDETEAGPRAGEGTEDALSTVSSYHSLPPPSSTTSSRPPSPTSSPPPSPTFTPLPSVHSSTDRL